MELLGYWAAPAAGTVQRRQRAYHSKCGTYCSMHAVESVTEKSCPLNNNGSSKVFAKA